MVVSVVIMVVWLNNSLKIKYHYKCYVIDMHSIPYLLGSQICILTHYFDAIDSLQAVWLVDLYGHLIVLVTPQFGPKIDRILML